MFVYFHNDDANPNLLQFVMREKIHTYSDSILFINF